MTFRRIYLTADLEIWVAVDPQDYAWACHHVWNSKPTQSFVSKHHYAKRNIGPARSPSYLHVEIARRAYGPAPDGKPLVDHISGNTLDCRRANLRYASYRENARNFGHKSFVLHPPPDVGMSIPF